MLAKEKNFIFQEVSAKNGTNINNLFYKDIFTQIKLKYNISGEEGNNDIANNGNRGNLFQFNKFNFLEEIKLDTPRNGGSGKKGCCK